MMAAQLENVFVPSRSRRVFYENPLTFTVSLSRQQWRDMRFARLIDPLDWPHEPRLVFADAQYLSSLELRGDFEYAAEQYRAALQRAVADRKMDVAAKSKLQHLQNFVRRRHVALVNLAIGYTWPGNPPGWIEFAE